MPLILCKMCLLLLFARILPLSFSHSLPFLSCRSVGMVAARKIATKGNKPGEPLFKLQVYGSQCTVLAVNGFRVTVSVDLSTPYGPKTTAFEGYGIDQCL